MKSIFDMFAAAGSILFAASCPQALAQSASPPPSIEIPGDGVAIEDQMSGPELYRGILIAGGTDPRTAQAIVLMEDERFAEAEELLRSIVADDLGAPDRFHRHLAGSEVNLGRALAGQGRYGEAELFFRRALERSQLRPDSETDIYAVTRHLSGLLVYQGRFVEAEPLLQKILSGSGKGTENSLFAQTAMAYVLLCEGSTLELAPLLQSIEEQISRFNYGGTYLENRLRRLQCLATTICRPTKAQLWAEASEAIAPGLPRTGRPVEN